MQSQGGQQEHGCVKMLCLGTTDPASYTWYTVDLGDKRYPSEVRLCQIKEILPEY